MKGRRLKVRQFVATPASLEAFIIPISRIEASAEEHLAVGGRRKIVST